MIFKYKGIDHNGKKVSASIEANGVEEAKSKLKAKKIIYSEIKESKNADMLILDLDKEPNEELAIHLILHRYNISKIYINGKLKKG